MNRDGTTGRVAIPSGPTTDYSGAGWDTNTDVASARLCQFAGTNATASSIEAGPRGISLTRFLGMPKPAGLAWGTLPAA